MGNICCKSAQATLPYPEVPGLHHFQVLGSLGRGTYAKVFKIKCVRTGRFFALKTLKKRLVLQSELQLQSECYILKHIESPFIVQLHQSFQNASKLYLVIDCMEGGSLFDLLVHYGHFSESQTAFYIAEVILALEALHTHSIVYRDLKPENILLAASGHLKLADFNLAKRADVPCTSLAGTDEYLAPEMLRHEAYGFSVDFWSVGVLAFELIAGHSPFYSTNRSVLFQRILEEDVVFEPNFSADACTLIGDLLRKDANARLQNFDDLKSYSFFREVDWNALENLIVKPPLRPIPGPMPQSTASESSEEETYEDFAYLHNL